MTIFQRFFFQIRWHCLVKVKKIQHYILTPKRAHKGSHVWFCRSSLQNAFGKAGALTTIISQIICNWCLLRKLESYPHWLKGHFLLNNASTNWRQMCRAHLQNLGNGLANVLALLQCTPQCFWKKSSCQIGRACQCSAGKEADSACKTEVIYLQDLI